MFAVTVVFGGIVGFLSMVSALLAGTPLGASLALYPIIGVGTVLLVMVCAGIAHFMGLDKGEVTAKNIGDKDITPIPVWIRHISD